MIAGKTAVFSGVLSIVSEELLAMQTDALDGLQSDLLKLEGEEGFEPSAFSP